MMFFSGKSIYPVGLDISDLSLKLVQFNKIGNKIILQALSKYNLPEGFISEGEIKNQTGVIKAIKNLINKPKFGKVTSNNVVACLPETKTFVKLIKIDKTPNNIADIIETEIGKHVPMLVDDIFYDWQVIEEKDDFQQILIGAAPKNVVNQYTNLLDQANLSIEALEIEPAAICRSLLKEESINYKGPFEKNYAIIDIGATRTSLTLYSKNTILFTISMPISGQEITRKIAEILQIGKDQAEKAKIICGLDKDKAKGVIYKILLDTINKLNKRIIEALDFYQSHFSERGPINNIFLCGGGANILKIDKIIYEATGLPVSKGDALVNLAASREKASQVLTEKFNLDLNFSKSKNKQKNILSFTQDSSASYATAFGLALRGIFINRFDIKH